MKKLLFRLFSSVFLLALAIAGFAVFWATQPILPDNQPAMVFKIDAGSSMRRATNQMVEQGVPVNATWLWLLARGTERASLIQAGTYELKAGTTPWELIDRMVAGDVMKESLTIIEGWTFRQMRALINANPSIRHDTAHLSDKELIARIAPQYSHPEGLFFPETYIFSPGSSDLVIYRQAFAMMQTQLNRAWEARNPDLPYRTPYDALIMASIIEKETGHELERDMIASVFVNRLRIGMRLQTDPTVIYGMGENYDGRIRRSDLITDTPYNTYTRAGLTPTPIALPGRASIYAAFNPAKSNAFYFVSRGDGTSHFSPTLQEHNWAVNKFIRGITTPAAPAAPVVPVAPVKKAPARTPPKAPAKTPAKPVPAKKPEAAKGAAKTNTHKPAAKQPQANK